MILYLITSYEWMFISDTINIINHALEWSPYALMDKLADHLSGHQDDLSKVKINSNKTFQTCIYSFLI